MKYVKCNYCDQEICMCGANDYEGNCIEDIKEYQYAVSKTNKGKEVGTKLWLEKKEREIYSSYHGRQKIREMIRITTITIFVAGIGVLSFIVTRPGILSDWQKVAIIIGWSVSGSFALVWMGNFFWEAEQNDKKIMRQKVSSLTRT